MERQRTPTGYKCISCGKIHYPKHARCLNCKKQEFNEIDLPSEGTLVTWTMLKAPPTGIDKHSLFLGIIDLGDVRYTGQLEIKPEEIQMGMRLKASWKQVREIDGKPYFGFVWTQS